MLRGHHTVNMFVKATKHSDKDNSIEIRGATMH